MGERQQQTWVYAGRRLVKGNALAHAWVDPSGAVLRYNGCRGDRYVIGGSYSVGVDRDSEGTTAVFGRRSVDVDRADETVEWEATSRVAETEKARVDTERRMGKESPLDDHLDVLAHAYRSAPWPQRTGPCWPTSPLGSPGERSRGEVEHRDHGWGTGPAAGSGGQGGGGHGPPGMGADHGRRRARGRPDGQAATPVSEP